jgi:hypothetical protein
MVMTRRNVSIEDGLNAIARRIDLLREDADNNETLSRERSDESFIAFGRMKDELRELAFDIADHADRTTGLKELGEPDDPT